MPRIGVYPGSFNPPTTAHVAIAAAALTQCDLERVVLAHSHRVLGKGEVQRPLFRHRMAVLDAVAADHHWLATEVTTAQLLVDIASGYDVVIMGADKWHQIHEVGWYADEAARDEAISRLPEVVVAPREPLPVPDRVRLRLPDEATAGISSSDARTGRLDVMAEAARRFAELSGAWIDHHRYDRFVAAGG